MLRISSPAAGRPLRVILLPRQDPNATFNPVAEKVREKRGAGGHRGRVRGKHPFRDRTQMPLSILSRKGCGRKRAQQGAVEGSAAKSASTTGPKHRFQSCRGKGGGRDVRCRALWRGPRQTSLPRQDPNTAFNPVAEKVREGGGAGGRCGGVRARQRFRDRTQMPISILSRKGGPLMEGPEGGAGQRRKGASSEGEIAAERSTPPGSEDV